MAEDFVDSIDIEEHDVLDNPTIRKIFPDISVLKKEITHFFDNDDIKPPASLNSQLGDINIDECDSENDVKENILQSNHSDLIDSCNFNANVISDISCLSTQNDNLCFYGNKIILGSKPSTYSNTTVANEVTKNKNPQLKVIVEDIQHSLSKNERYCSKCKILFFHTSSMSRHKKLVHHIRTKQYPLVENDYTKYTKCNICSAMLSSRSNLLRHLKNVHNKNPKTIKRKRKTTSETKKCIQPNSNKRKSCYICSHCNKKFLSASALIEHMYIVANNRERVNNSTHSKSVSIHTGRDNDVENLRDPENTCSPQIPNAKIIKNCQVRLENVGKFMKPLQLRNSEKQTLNHDDKRESTDLNNFMRCSVCSYYFKNIHRFNKHAIKWHKLKQTPVIKKVNFDGNCKNCSLKFNDIPSYNIHLYNNHRNLFKEVVIETKLKKKSASLEIGTQVLTKDEDDTLLKSKLQKSVNDIVGLVAYKNMLFRCTKCDLFFLSAYVAMMHTEHMELLVNWKCQTCNRIFKSEDELTHKEQHRYFEHFDTFEMNESLIDKVLFKCKHCDVHYAEENFIPHYSSCCSKTSNVTASKSRTSTNCHYCKILIDQSIIQSHKDSHRLKNYILKDFIIIDSAFIIEKVEKSHAVHAKTITNNNSDLDRPISKNNSYSNKDDRYTVKSALKKGKVNSIRNRRNERTSEEFNIFSRKDKHIKSPNKGSNLQTKLVQNAKARLKIVFKSNSWQEFVPNMFYCKTCKSFVSDVALTRKSHTMSRCSNIVKYPCVLCGLVLSNNALKTHMNLHKFKKDLKLQDFKFLDENGALVCPTVPEYPKCDNCEVHFVRKASVTIHSCSDEKYLICHICKIKLSETAFKLHESFHVYSIEYWSKNKSSISIEELKLDESENTAKITNPNNVSVPQLLYTCKSCGITLDTYDSTVEHCQKHYNKNNFVPYKCNECEFSFDIGNISQHYQLHERKIWKAHRSIEFDLSYFTSENHIWSKNVFNSLSKEEADDVVSKSIYRYEHRIKMELHQDGPFDLTFYKCDRCRTFVDPNLIFKHAENLCNQKSRKHPCSVCGLPFESTISRSNHSKIHTRPGLGLNSYRIVMFNKETDKKFNNSIISCQNIYILYQCRNCNCVVSKHQESGHKCEHSNLKMCDKCGLLIDHHNYDSHIDKHKFLSNFNEESIKVVLFGKDLKGGPKDKIQIKNKRRTFSGKVLDYKFFKCSVCGLCFRSENSHGVLTHKCENNQKYSSCFKCPVVLPNNEMREHLMLHENEIEFNKEHIDIVVFVETQQQNCNLDETVIRTEKDSTVSFEKHLGSNFEIMLDAEKSLKLYKCTICDLCFPDKMSGESHLRNCNSKIKNTNQKCSKCNLNFTPADLFKHLKIQHAVKQVNKNFDIVEIHRKEV
uniref:C2H2-type domain-containing protein n=2 Tax=Bombyx mori TaxID=7091 RepID=A0A8R2C741_BOMMO|nr:zinc finger protein 91 isoform X2 [Bombyx mori]